MARDAYERSYRRRERFRQQVFAMWGDLCWMCGGVATTADHMITRKQIRDLGLDTSLMFDPENGRPACARCNSGRGAKPVSQVLGRRKGTGVVVADGW